MQTCFSLKTNQGTFAWGGTASYKAGTFIVQWLCWHIYLMLNMYPKGEIKGSDLPPSEAGAFLLSPRALDLMDAMPQAMLLIRRCFVNYTNFQKMQIEGLKTTHWKTAFPFRGGGLALSKNDREYLVLEWTRIQYYCACFKELHRQCSGGKIRKKEISWVSFESLGYILAWQG